MPRHGPESALDYIFADPVSVPTGTHRVLSGASGALPVLLVLPATADCPNLAPLPALTRGYVTFGSFDRPGKLSDEALTLWARVLRAAPASRLLLKFGGLDDQAVRERILAVMAGAGVDPARVASAAEHPGRASRGVWGGRRRRSRFPRAAVHRARGAVRWAFPSSCCSAIPCRGFAGCCCTGLASPSCYGTPDAYVEAAVSASADLPRLARQRSVLRERLAASPVRQPLLPTPRWSRMVSGDVAPLVRGITWRVVIG